MNTPEYWEKYADEVPARGLTIDDVDLWLFKDYFKKNYGEELEKQPYDLQTLLNNMNLAKGVDLNLAGALLFSRNTQYKLPLFMVKAVAYPTEKIDIENYMDSRDINGSLLDIFNQTVSFITMNIRHKQAGQNINSVGIPEISKIALEELVANALVHRDYFVSAPIRVFVFSNRVEIVSPGHLPNKLSVANIKAGNSNIRNPILASFASKILPYRGLGTGIRRALEAHPAIDFIDDREGNFFHVVIHK